VVDGCLFVADVGGRTAQQRAHPEQPTGPGTHRAHRPLPAAP